MGVLEIHPWGSRIEKLETPDRVTIDLDPDEGLPWERVTEAAINVREALLGIGLKSFAKTTGGKGLHVVIPLTPKFGWDDVKAFAKWIADSFVAQRPEDFTANMAKKARQGRIYIDYLRIGRGATGVAAPAFRGTRVPVHMLAGSSLIRSGSAEPAAGGIDAGARRPDGVLRRVDGREV